MLRRRAGLALLGAATLVTACAGGATAPVAQADAAGGPVTCREVLPAGSNVLQTLCLDDAGWARYDLERRRKAQELVRNLQGGYGGF